MERDMIHVCLSFHDEQGLYSKLAGVTICSLFAHTLADVTVHLFCDMVISEETRQKFAILAEQYGQTIIFHHIEVQLPNTMLDMASRWTVGTLLRLYLPESLQLEKVIYLDADLIINLDIATLWSHDISSYSLAACVDEGFASGWRKYEQIEQGMFERKKYFNAGVMVLNLARIRQQHDLLKEAIAFMGAYPECRFADQDAMNNIFREEILLLPSQFNCMVGIQRKQHISELRECIYHYAGDDGRPHYLFCDAFDTLFWQHFRMTPWYHDADKQHFWQEKSLAKQEQIRWLCDSEQKIRGRKKIFWGAGGCLHDAIRSHFQAQDGDYYIDTLQEKWGKRRAGLPICSPAALTAEKRGTFAIIVVTMQYVEVARKLQACGLVENEDFFDGRKFVPERAGGYPDWAIV